MEYQEFLAKAPAHNSPEFLDFLRENNPVVFEDAFWIVVENYKYHTRANPWYTAFIKDVEAPVPWMSAHTLYHHAGWEHWNWLRKAADKRTIDRFHIHIHK